MGTLAKPREKVSIAQAMTLKRTNAEYLSEIINAEHASSLQATLLAVSKFTKTIHKLCSSSRFQNQVLPQLLNGDVSAYEALSPRPDPDLCVWAAERLVPPTDGLFIRNAQTWQELIYNLFTVKDGMIADELDQESRATLTEQFDAWKHATPHLFRPVYKEQPTTSGIIALFNVLLGRPPNKNDDMSERKRQGYPAICRSLMRSREFQRHFMAWLGGQRLPQAKASKANLAECAAEMVRIFAWQADPYATAEAMSESWEALLDGIWLSPERRADLLSILLDDSEPTDQFISQLVNTSCDQLQHGHGLRLINAVVDSGEIRGILVSDQPVADGQLTVGVYTGGPACIQSMPMSTLKAGRNNFTIGLALESLTHQEGGGALRLEVSPVHGDVSCDVMRRPMLGESTPLAAKVAWQWSKGNFARAEGILLDLDTADNIGLAHLMEVIHHRLSGRTAYGQTLVERRAPNWRTLAPAIEARWRGDFMQTPLPEDVADWFTNDSDASAAALNWFRGIYDGGALSVLLAEASADTPSNAFKSACAAFSSAPEIASALKGLLLIGANDEHLALAASGLEDITPKRVSTVFRKEANAMSLGGLLCAAAAAPAAFAHRHDLVIGAAKYSENSRRPSKAVDITLHAIDNTPSPSKHLLNFASTICNKWGDATKAADLLKQVLVQQPKDVQAMGRYLNLERGLTMANPLRATPELSKMGRRYREGVVKSLIQRPGDPERLESLAQALIIERDDSGALDVLSDLYDTDRLSGDGLKKLIDLCVKTNANERALELCEALQTEELSEWVVINHARALRALDRADEAGEILNAHASSEWQAVSREAVRNLFFLADFEGAAHRGDALCIEQAEDIELRLVCAAAHLELGRLFEAAAHVAQARDMPKADRFQEELDLFDYAIERKRNAFDAIHKLNPMFARLGCSSLDIKPGSTGTFDDFTLARVQDMPDAVEHMPLTDGPLVSVVMTSYNSSDFIDTAIESILNQRYRNIELIVSDDMSTDDTREKLLRWQQFDPRVKPILKTENSGTYVSKNMGLLKALGTYVALQDSDDWSHPDRIGKSVAVLEQRNDLQALTTDWLRMTSEGHLAVKAGGQISHVCCISLVFRRAPVMDRIGLFDSVRIEADMEYIRRIQLAFGRRSLARLRWPLLFGRVRSDSLTGNEEFGISRTGFSPPRLEYQAHQAAWHDQIRAGASPLMPFPLETRKFAAPAIILPNKEEDA